MVCSPQNSEYGLYPYLKNEGPLPWMFFDTFPNLWPLYVWEWLFSCVEICFETDQPKFRVQDCSWANHKDYEKKKLRDVLQEREGASFNYFLTISNNLSAYRCILVYNNLSQAILSFLGISRIISDYHRPSRTISGYLKLARAILGFLRLSWAISGYLGLSQASLGYLGLS